MTHDRPRPRPRGRTLAALLALATILPLATTIAGASPTAASPAAESSLTEGTSEANAAASCWEIKQTVPSSPDGVYWLVTPKLREPERFYCDMTTDGGGWVLVGRGREDWEYGRTGLDASDQVREVVSGPDAFSPRQLDGDTIDGLLNGTRVSALADGVRVRRAANIEGTAWQDNRMRFASMGSWIWPFGGHFPLTSTSIGRDGSVLAARAGGDVFDVATAAGDGYRTVTYQLSDTGYRSGWAYGPRILGSTSPTSYLWSPIGSSAVPFAQVFIRPTLTTPGVENPTVTTPASVTVESVVPFQIVQRASSGTGDIPVAGRYVGSATRIEARWNGGAWQTIDATPRAGFFEGVLEDQPAGQGALEVRLADGSVASTSVARVGVGDLFVIAGQSNAVGYGTSIQPATHPTLTATMFGHNESWGALRDPVSSSVGQIDLVNTNQGNSSPWPLLATRIMAKTGVPVAFVPTAKGGTSIRAWAEGSALYNSMTRRIDAVGGRVKAVLWYQGESDAIAKMSQVDYDARLTAFVQGVARAAAGAPTLVGMIGQYNPAGYALDPIRRAQKAVVDREPLALPGPVTYDIDLRDESGDGIHFKSNPDRAKLIARWWAALDEAFYGGGHGSGPELDVSRSWVDPGSKAIFLRFSGHVVSAATSSPAPAAFRVASGSTAIPVTRVLVHSDGTVRLVLGAVLRAGQPVKVLYASANSGVNAALRAASGLPAFPFPVTIIPR